MRNNDVLDRLTFVFRKTLGDPGLILSPGTTAHDVQGWDSLMHINLIVAAEKEFKTRFTTREITALRNIGDLLDLIARKEGAGAPKG